MSNNKKNTKEALASVVKNDKGLMLFNDHKRPFSRRDFLAAGIITGSAMAIVPNIPFLGQQALAATGSCDPVVFNETLGTVVFDMAGGMNMAGNFVIGFKRGGGQMDWGSNNTSDFVNVGIPNNQHPVVLPPNREFGIAMHQTSGVLRGMKSILDNVMVNGRPIKEKITGYGMAGKGGDDTNTNPINPLFMIAKAGGALSGSSMASGRLVTLVGNSNSVSGGNSMPAGNYDKSIRPALTGDANQAKGLLGLGGLSGNNFLNVGTDAASRERLQNFLAKMKTMGDSKLAQFNNLNSVQQIQATMGCTLDQAKNLFQQFSSTVLDPANNPNIQTIFGNGGNQGVKTVGHLTFGSGNGTDNQLSLGGTVTLGGYDYHDGTAASGNMRDEELGINLANLILLASRAGKDAVFYLITDGATVGDAGGAVDASPAGRGRVNNVSDQGTQNVSVCIIYSHHFDATKHSPIIAPDRTQIGNFRPGGGADSDAPNAIAGNQDAMWRIHVYNWMNLLGVASKFETVFGNSSLPPGAASMLVTTPLPKKA